MARLTDTKREDIKNALMLGDSQYKVSQQFEVSSATVNKIFKSIPIEELDKLKGIVKEEVAIKSKLSGESERLVKAFDTKVNDELRRANLVFGGVEKAVQKMNEIINDGYVEDKINVGDGMQKFENRKLNTTDIKNAIDGYDKASVTLGVNERFSNSQINVNTQNNIDNRAIAIEWE
ncbi:hypothetical protein [Poseidonibacter sp.]|uniref:hypothetical protein n=1 Tax=Poseidonibacter sp. TaxID=2321188 RepID=UPI003C771162